MAESAGDVDKLLDTLKSQGQTGHAVNIKVNSHQRLPEYAGHITRCLY